MTRIQHPIPSFLFALLFTFVVQRAQAQAPNSAWVYPSATGNLLYQLDASGQRIADFSNCGYFSGTAALPDVTALISQSRWVYLNPSGGDDTAAIQAAINTVSAMTPDANGWRGVVYLNAGQYQLSSTGSLSAVTVTTAGSGYTSTPVVTISGGGGSGAAATATISSGSISGVTVTKGGSGYTSTPVVTISGGGGSGAAATATISGSPALNIAAGGVVLKGAGSSSTTGTRLQATTPIQYTAISVSGSGSYLTYGSGSRVPLSGTTHNFTQTLAPAGTRTFQVDSTSGLAVGNTVIVYRPSTANWITALGMDQLGPASGGDSTDVPWTAGSKDLFFDRVITRIDGNWITVDAPLPQTFDSQYGGGQVWAYNWNRIQQVGIEDIYGFSYYDPTVTAYYNKLTPTYQSDENHAWYFIYMANVQNGWVRDIIAQYFGYSAVAVDDGAKWITVADSQCLTPVSILTGERRYCFNNLGAELTLFVNNYTNQGRHDFVFGGSTVSGPNAFVYCTTGTSYEETGPHQRWSVGGLYDNVTVNNDISVQNRGNLGTGHGWAGAYFTVWNSWASYVGSDGTVYGFRVRNPPTACNWLVGSIGPLLASSYPAPSWDDFPGNYDKSGPVGTGTNVYPQSLYYGQLQQRLKWASSEFREAWLGNITQFTGASTAVNCDATWLSQVQALGSTTVDSNFDSLVGNRYTAFTFNLNLDPGDTVVAASLTVSLRATSTASSGDTILLGSTGNVQTYSSLGWSAISSTGSTVCTMEVDPSLLTAGQLNVALGLNSVVDFATLSYQVQTNPTYSVTLSPAADAYVRGGTYANTNFGSATTLATKDITASSVNRESFLRWNLNGLSGTILGAKVRLAGTVTNQTGNESCASVVSDNTWIETGANSITFNNKPASGQPFATWLPVSGQPVQFDVTSQVAAAIAGGGQISLRIRSTGDYGSNGNVSYASRENATVANRPQLILTFLNNPPAISSIANLSIAENATTGALAFTVGDDFTPSASLTVSGSSSNTTLVPVGNITLAGSGASRTVTITPAANQSGTANITLSVNDGTLTTSTSFLLTVDPPWTTWQKAQFGVNWNNPAIAGDSADPDQDGISNLYEYALGGNPNLASQSILPQTSLPGGKLALTFTRTLANTDITMTVQASDSMTGSWTNLASSSSGAAFAALTGGVTVTETGSGATRSVQVSDLYLISNPAHPHRFMRLLVTRP